MKIKLTMMVVLVAFVTANLLAQQPKKTEIIKIKTSAQCGMCKDRIEQNMAYVKGITDVVLDLSTKIATITYKPARTTPDAIRQALSKLGYDADNVAADPKAYKALPACCKKPDDPAHKSH